MWTKCIRLWEKYKFLAYPASCLVLVLATIYTLYQNPDGQRPPQFHVPTQSMVLIVAYMRSGSSFVGDILQQHDSSFYVFEPLRSAVERTDRNQSIKFYNGTETQLRTTEEEKTFYEDTLYNWLTCNLRDLDIGTLTSNYLLYYSRSTRSYSICLAHYEFSQSGLDYCLQTLMVTCAAANFRIIKSIRIDMDIIPSLMHRLPNLKVIHLIRDPRGIMNSRVKVKLSNWLNLVTEVNDLCSSIVRNIETAEKVKQKFPDRTKLLVYEQLSEYPTEISRDLFGFVDMDFSPLVQRRLDRLTHNRAQARDCDWCTKKANSTKTALMWRTEIDFQHALVIEKHCGGVYDLVGYLRTKDEQTLRNLSISLHNRILPVGTL